MKHLPLFQIDAFTSELFSGNPAAVVPLDTWLPDDVMQSIAAENNLAETAFFAPEGDRYRIRWFTPSLEVKLCGHATLASAFVLFEHLGFRDDTVRFDSLSGELSVSRDGNRLVMDFPAWPVTRVDDIPMEIEAGLGRCPAELYVALPDRNYYAVFESESDVRRLLPEFDLLATLHPDGVVATAPGDHSDCASRFFLPSYGIPEDPATGSIHSALVPFWAARLDRPKIHARQVSERGGEFFCEDRGQRVIIAGHAVGYLEGRIALPG